MANSKFAVEVREVEYTINKNGVEEKIKGLQIVIPNVPTGYESQDIVLGAVYANQRPYLKAYLKNLRKEGK